MKAKYDELNEEDNQLAMALLGGGDDVVDAME